MLRPDPQSVGIPNDAPEVHMRFPIPSTRFPCRIPVPFAVAALAILLATLPRAAAAKRAAPADTASVVDVIQVDGVITPITAEQVAQAIHRAETDRRAALVLQMDTPGGLETAMR